MTLMYSVFHQYYIADQWQLEITSSLHLCLKCKTWPDRWRLWRMACSESVLSAFSPRHLLKCGMCVQLPRDGVLQVDTPLSIVAVSDIDPTCAVWKLLGYPCEAEKLPLSSVMMTQGIWRAYLFFITLEQVLSTGGLTYSRHSLNVDWPFSLVVPGPSREWCITYPVVWLPPLHVYY